LGPHPIGIVVEQGSNEKPPIPKAIVASQRRTEIARTHDCDAFNVVGPENALYRHSE
jgi:hypothetical protein